MFFGKAQCREGNSRLYSCFERLFVSFMVMKIDITNGYKPFIGLDECQLKES